MKKKKYLMGNNFNFLQLSVDSLLIFSLSYHISPSKFCQILPTRTVSLILFYCFFQFLHKMLHIGFEIVDKLLFISCNNFFFLEYFQLGHYQESSAVSVVEKIPLTKSWHFFYSAEFEFV